MLNKVHLIGHLGADPEIGSTHNGQGTPFAKFNIATSERWTDKRTGEKKDRTEWHRIVVFGDQLADFCHKHLKKGSKIWLEGALKSRRWTDKNGIERYTTEVVLQPFKGSIEMLDRADRGPAVPDPGGPEDYGLEGGQEAA